jgi:hypothetical protein
MFTALAWAPRRRSSGAVDAVITTAVLVRIHRSRSARPYAGHVRRRSAGARASQDRSAAGRSLQRPGNVIASPSGRCCRDRRGQPWYQRSDPAVPATATGARFALPEGADHGRHDEPSSSCRSRPCLPAAKRRSSCPRRRRSGRRRAKNGSGNSRFAVLELGRWRADADADDPNAGAASSSASRGSTRSPGRHVPAVAMTLPVPAGYG